MTGRLIGRAIARWLAAASVAAVMAAETPAAGATPEHPSGCRSFDTGRLVAPWPCHYVRMPDGSVAVFTGLEPPVAAERSR